MNQWCDSNDLQWLSDIHTANLTQWIIDGWVAYVIGGKPVITFVTENQCYGFITENQIYAFTAEGQNYYFKTER